MIFGVRSLLSIHIYTIVATLHLGGATIAGFTHIFTPSHDGRDANAKNVFIREICCLHEIAH